MAFVQARHDEMKRNEEVITKRMEVSLFLAIMMAMKSPPQRVQVLPPSFLLIYYASYVLPVQESEKRLEELQEEIQANQMKARNDLLGKDVEIAMKHSQLEVTRKTLQKNLYLWMCVHVQEKDKQIQVLEQEILNKSKEISALTEKTQVYTQF